MCILYRIERSCSCLQYVKEIYIYLQHLVRLNMNLLYKIWIRFSKTLFSFEIWSNIPLADNSDKIEQIQTTKHKNSTRLDTTETINNILKRKSHSIEFYKFELDDCSIAFQTVYKIQYRRISFQIFPHSWTLTWSTYLNFNTWN